MGDGETYRGGSRLYHLYNMIYCFEELTCGTFSSKKKEIFSDSLLYVDEILSTPLCKQNLNFFPVNSYLELEQNPGNNLILSPTYLFATTGISGKY